MNRKGFILVLLSVSWPITCAHMIWLGHSNIVHWFIDNQWDYIQSYFYYLFDIISWLLIMFAMWLYINSNIRKDKDIILMFGALLVNAAIDLPHYLICRRNNDYIIFIQGMIYLYAASKILYNQILKR